MADVRAGDPPSVHPEASLATERMGTMMDDESFLPNTSLGPTVSDDQTPLPDQAQNSVLGMPVIPAEEIEESTASMIEIREEAPAKKGDVPETIHEPEEGEEEAKIVPPKPSNGRRAWLWSTVESEEDFIKLVEEFRRQGFPLGLATEVCTDKMEAPFRLWLVDNNASLEQYKDQHVLRYRAEDATVQLASCTRWAELLETLESHALLADLMKVTGYFWLIRYDAFVIL